MSLGRILFELRRRGVTLTVQGDELRARGPRGVVDDGLRAEIAAQRDELLRWTLVAQCLARVAAPCATGCVQGGPAWDQMEAAIDRAFGEDLVRLRDALACYEAFAAAWCATWSREGMPPEDCGANRHTAWKPRPLQLGGGWVCGRCHPLDPSCYRADVGALELARAA